jgi:hypothetical protein
MKILPIEKPTKKDNLELENLNKKEKTKKLTDKEASRQIFLSVKNLWNCEC